MSGRTKLNRKQEALIAALLTEPTHAAAAVRAGVSEATVHRWLRLPEFQAAYRQARRSIVEASIGRLQRATGKAVEALERNLSCGHAGNQIRAALGILDHAVKAVELVDLIERVEELERLLQGVRDDEPEETRPQTARRGADAGREAQAGDPEPAVPERDLGGAAADGGGGGPARVDAPAGGYRQADRGVPPEASP